MWIQMKEYPNTLVFTSLLLERCGRKKQKPVLSVLETKSLHTTVCGAVTDPCIPGSNQSSLLLPLLWTYKYKKLYFKASSNVMLNKTYAKDGA